MAKLIGRTMTEMGEVVIDDAVLAKGGEGKVHNLVSHNLSDLPKAEELVAKIYFEPGEANRGPKVVAMLNNAPDDQSSIAWVKAALFNENKKFVGYLMRKLDTKSFRPWSELSNTKDRQQTAPQFDVKYALNASRNFLVAIHFIHEAGHKVGDINESNLFVNTNSTVMLVDMDSAQIANGGKIYPCEVAKPEYTAAEISHGKIRDNPRTAETDIFAFSVMMFQMLTGGAHPMDGIYVPDEDPPSVIEKIRLGALPTLQPGFNKKFKPTPRIPAQAIPQSLRQILIESLSNNPAARPNSTVYLQVLDDVISNIIQCTVEDKHWFDSRDGACGWCAHKKSGNFDPWGNNDDLKKKNASRVSQSSLPDVSFNEQAKPSAARRAAPRVSPSGIPQRPQNAPRTNAAQNQSNPSSNASRQPANATGNTAQNNPAYTQQAPSNLPYEPPYRPEKPQMHKGKLVLEYADGSMRQRPPMGDLIKHNPKIARYAFVEEFPSTIKVWWDRYRYTAKIPALIIGLVLALIIAVGWIPIVDQLNNVSQIPYTEYNAQIIKIIGYVSASTAAIGSIILFLSAIFARRKDTKIFGKDMLQEESLFKTILRFLAVGFYYGPLFLITLLVFVIFGIFSFVSAAVKAT